MEKEKKISWLQYQLGEKWFLLTLLAIIIGVIGVVWFDGGWVWGTLFGTIAALLGIYGGVLQWLNYKKDKNT